jgi:uncharacterized membrane protein (UPF0182 family)
MSNWFDKLLEELQRRQAEQDARREGRPIPPFGPRRPGGNGHDQGNGHEAGGEEPTPFRPLRPRALRPGGSGRRPRWGLIIGILVVLFLVFGVLGSLVSLVTDLMWYDALGLRSVLTTRLWSQVALFVLGFVAFVLPALASIWLARRIAPQVPIRRIGTLELPDVSQPVTLALAGVVVLLGLISAAAWSANWQTVLLFINGGSFGQVDPHFGHDVGFYIFDLPFWRFLQGWGVTSLVVIILLTLGTYAVGALRWQLRLTAPVRAHLSTLGALLLVAIAAGYQFDIAELSYSTRGVSGTIQAATYTDIHAQMPAYVILTVVALASAALLLANIWFKTLWAILLAAGAWIGITILVGGVYPSIVQRLNVDPNELAVEQPYIAQNIAATRAAFGLDAIDVRSFTGEQTLTRPLITANQATVDNLRLWDYKPLLTTFGQQQILRQYYQFVDVDIDRYMINGAERQLMLSGREIGTLPQSAQTWTSQRLVYTHGYGITAVPVNAVTPEGQPDYLVSGINSQPTLPVGQPRLYFGEAASSYVVVGTRTDEFDYPLGDQGGKTTTWNGTTGVGVGNFFSRLLFALRFGDLNLLISNQLTDHSQILFRRQIAERVQELAPFLTFDHDPYLVTAGGRLVWMWDAYTTSDRYPDAQPLSDIFPGMNYVRNSVKVVIDAYDGSVHFYVNDPADPIIQAYAKIFPRLLEPLSAMPAALRAHLRYPEDLFTAQNEAYLLYHLDANAQGAQALYKQEDRWAFPVQQTDVSSSGSQLTPYYVIMKLPGESKPEFVLIQPLVAAARPNMISWIAARMDPGHYGERISFRFPSGSTTPGPAQIQARINQDSTVSAQFTLWSQAGSSVVRGNLLVLPMGDSILYVEPIFLQSTQSPFPEFKRVILAGQNRLVFADTVEHGISELLGETSAPPTDSGGGGVLPSDVASLVADAQRLYNAAQAALAAGDLGTYQARIDDLARVIAALGKLVGTPSPSASPSAAPGG